MLDVWIAPYLPLDEEQAFGPWRIVPFDHFKRTHATNVGVYNEVRRLRTAYKVSDSMSRLGGIVLPVEGRVGEDVDRGLITRVANAIAGAALESNPKPVADGGEEPNAGHGLVCAENLSIFGHPLTGQRSYTLQSGAMATRLASYAARPGRPLPKIKPPNDLPTPLWFSFDEEYAAAVLATIESGTAEAGRVNLAIEWLRLAWDNSASVTARSRVLSLRSGFEALLGGGSNTKQLRARLSDLLEDPKSPRVRREWTEHGRQKSEDLTDLQYWFQTFSILRNQIAHGDIVDLDSAWLFDDHHQVRYAEEILRRAIKRTVAVAVADPLIEESPTTRHLVRELSRIGSEEADQALEG